MKAFALSSVVLLLLTAACKAPREEIVRQVDFEELVPVLQSESDTVYVVNFWATWCKPCVEELPAFEELREEYDGHRVKIILVSLDFPNKYQSHLVPYVKENGIQCRVLHLTEVNANLWIDRVDPSWSGAIPATLVYRGGDRTFFEGKLSYEELRSLVEEKL